MGMTGYKIFLSQADKLGRPEPVGKPDTTKLADAIRHLNADWRNAVWIDGHFVRAVGWSDGEPECDFRLIVDAVVTDHTDLRRLLRSRDWPEEP
jgi:hypothetical protein